MRRAHAERLQPLLADLDGHIERGHIFKTGGAATVARVELDGRPLLVKRYNIKSRLHWLKRCWRPSRAWHSWIAGNRLDFLGIATWIFDIYLAERLNGISPNGAWTITENAIRATDEWRGKH